MTLPRKPWPLWVEFPKDQEERKAALQWLKVAERQAWLELAVRVGIVAALFLGPPAALAWALWRMSR